MQSVATSYNPSDYEYLIRSLTQDTPQGRSESLKRLNTFVMTDKKQFSGYAKRIVLVLQDLLLEPREDVNLLASTLTLQIINMNLRDIEYYVRTKLLKNLVKNLGDMKPQIRKTSHYCLLAYVKAYKSFDDLISNYIMEGLYSDNWQLKQKCINSFQSILIMELKHLNWVSPDFKRFFQLLIDKLNDDSPYVQKAAQQCLISLCKLDGVKALSRRISPGYLALLKTFLENQKKNGTIQQIKIDVEENKPKPSQTPDIMENKTLSSAGQSLLSFQRTKIEEYRSFNMPQIVKIEATSGVPEKKQTMSLYHEVEIAEPPLPFEMLTQKTESRKKLDTPIKRQQKRDVAEPTRASISKVERRATPLKQPPLLNIVQPLFHAQPIVQINQQQNIQSIMGKKVLQDLKNDKDWKVRSDAIEELQKKFDECKDRPEAEGVLKSLLPILLKMLGDSNFKISLASMKMIEEIFQNAALNLEVFYGSLIEKLADSKIAIRQNVAKVIKNQFMRDKSAAWIDNLLMALKKPTANGNLKQQILSLLHRFYEGQEAIDYSYEKVLTQVCPLMEDIKTKIKIKTLDCLVMITLKSGELEVSKNIIGTSINQVYYEMYIEKLNKQLKTGRWNLEPTASHLFSNKKSLHKNTMTTSTSSKNQTTSFTRQEMNELGKSNTVSVEISNAAQDRRRKFSSGTDLQSKRSINHHYNTNTSLAMTNQRPLSITGSSRRTADQDDSVSEKSYGVVKSFRKKIIRNDSKTEYTSRDMLQPLQNCQRQFKLLVEQLKSEEWQVSFEALNKLRRVIENHSELLTSTHLHGIVQDILKLVQSARSSLSKNAMITLNELTIKMKRLLDPELDYVFGKLIKKAADTNSFITEEVKKALVALAQHCSQNKIIALLQNHHQSKSFSVKQSIIYIMENIALLPKFMDKDLPKMVGILVDYLSEGSLEIRDRTKKIILQLLDSNRGDEVSRMIPVDFLNKLKKKQSKEEREQQPAPVVEPEPVEIISPVRKAKLRITTFPTEFDNLESSLHNCQSSDWKVRVEAMKQIHQLALQFPHEFAQHKLSSRVIDVLSKQISDPNIKVATNALTIFGEMAKRIPTIIESNLPVVTNEIFNCFGSNKQEVKQQSQNLFDCIADSIETWMLFQHLCNAAIYGIQKARPVILDKLVAISGRVYNKKPLIYGKNIYSTLNKLLDENRPDMQAGLQRLAESCYDLVGNDIFSNTKSKIKEYIG